MDTFFLFLHSSGFANFNLGNFAMLFLGFIFLYFAIAKDWEPLLLVPIGFGILCGNIPIPDGAILGINVADPLFESVENILYEGIRNGVYPAVIFLGIGAMTDFSAMISNPKTIVLGAAAQGGVFFTFLVASLLLGFEPVVAAAIGLIGGADGPTSIYLATKLAPKYLAPISIAAYSYIALVPMIQPPIMKLLTTKKERLIRMPSPRKVTRLEKIIFPIVAFLISAYIAPYALPLLGLLFLGNLMKESGVTDRLARSAATVVVDFFTIIISFCVGASAQASTFLSLDSIKIFALGMIAFGISTATGILFAKGMNLFLKEGNKINPLIGAAGVSAVPDSARIANQVGREADPDNFLLMHAMSPNVAGVIGTAIAAGIFLSIFMK